MPNLIRNISPASTSPRCRGHSILLAILLDKKIALCDIANMSEIGFTTAAARQWLKLSPQIRDRIGKKLETFAATGQGDVKQLKGQAGARLRVAIGASFSTKRRE